MMVKIQNGGDVISAFAIRLMLYACVFTLLEIILFNSILQLFSNSFFIFMALMLTLQLLTNQRLKDKVFKVGQR